MAIDLQHARLLSQRVEAEASARARLDLPWYVEPLGVAATLCGTLVATIGVYWLDGHWAIKAVVCGVAAAVPTLVFQVICLRRRMAALQTLLGARAVE